MIHNQAKTKQTRKREKKSGYEKESKNVEQGKARDQLLANSGG